MPDCMGIPLSDGDSIPGCNCWTKVVVSTYKTPPNGLAGGGSETFYEYSEMFCDANVELGWHWIFSYCPICGKESKQYQEE